MNAEVPVHRTGYLTKHHPITDKLHIVSWNVNSVRERITLIAQLITDIGPDILLLQEIKCEDSIFPREKFDELGYDAVVVGQKQYNGVATLYKKEFSQLEYQSTKLQKYKPEEARYVEIVVKGIRISNLYVPNGENMSSESYKNKVDFLNCLSFFSDAMLFDEDVWIMMGDFNVIPRNMDTSDKTSRWESTGLACQEIRKLWRRIVNQGWLDAGEKEGKMTWQGYRNPDVKLRIDHALLSPGAADALESFDVLEQWRDVTKPSDHMPISLKIDLSKPRNRLAKWRENFPLRSTLTGVLPPDYIPPKPKKRRPTNSAV